MFLLVLHASRKTTYRLASYPLAMCLKRLLAGLCLLAALPAACARPMEDRPYWNIPQRAMLPVWEHDSRYALPQAEQQSNAGIIPHSQVGRDTGTIAAAFDSRPWFHQAESSTSTPQESQDRPEIPAFRTDRNWGPFPVGNKDFEPKGYPVEMDEFKHLYEDSRDVRDADFEKFLKNRGGIRSQNPVRFLHAWGPLFYPEPKRLDEIQNTIWSTLRSLEGSRAPCKVVLVKANGSGHPLKSTQMGSERANPQVVPLSPLAKPEMALSHAHGTQDVHFDVTVS